MLVFFRLVVLACKAGMSCVFYREFRRDLGKPAALLAALVLFAFVPKWFLGPDYTGQQFHWTLAAFLCLHHYVTRGCKQLWLVPAGRGVCLLRVFGLPPKRGGLCRAVDRHADFGQALWRAETPRRLGAAGQLRRLRCGVSGVCALRRGVQHLAAAQPA